ncbi:hypothetical protein [Actinobaculum massiliense]|uniref:hypothetical protein n=1 Tax=Actinobaculum massiliense TaxID=202789 RepID=UPI00071AF319|nr:hypothetical protein [Actinobaculum massiliense]
MGQSIDEIMMGLILEAVPEGIDVYDGIPNVRLEDRTQTHIIVNLSAPLASSVTLGGQGETQTITAQIRTIVRTGGDFDTWDAYRQARRISRHIRDYLTTRKITPTGSRIAHTLERALEPVQAMASHEAAVEISQYEAHT